MNAYEELLKLYERCPQRSLNDDIRFHLEHGYVFAAPGYILIGRRVGHGWLIHVAVGTDCFKKFCELMPYWLPHIGWAREHRGNRSEVRWHRTETVFRKVGYHGRIITNTTAPAARPKQIDCGEQGPSRATWSEEATRIRINHINERPGGQRDSGRREDAAGPIGGHHARSTS